MLDGLKKIDAKKTGIFAAGVLFGTAGIKLLSSKDAKKLYKNCTAAVLRAKDCVMNVVTNIQENAEDIYAEAKQMNEEREAEELDAEFEDVFADDVEDEFVDEFEDLAGKCSKAEGFDVKEEKAEEFGVKEENI